MCGLPVPFLSFLILLVILGAVVFKLRGWFKKGSPALEHLRDNGNDFTLFLVICLAMVLAPVLVAQTILEHNDKITAFFAAVREKCEPPPDTRTWQEKLEQDLEAIRKKESTRL